MSSTPRYSTLEILNPQPPTLDPRPSTLDPRPSTLNPELVASWIVVAHLISTQKQVHTLEPDSHEKHIRSLDFHKWAMGLETPNSTPQILILGPPTQVLVEPLPYIRGTDGTFGYGKWDCQP